MSDGSNWDLDIEKIKRAEDFRTTIMIRNIPNKYNQSALLSELNVRHQGRFDFLYLPIDFSNNANVGYAFVNFVHPLFIIDLYKEFMGRDWPKYRSQKKCDIKYARLQGFNKLMDHFKHSSVLNQDVISDHLIIYRMLL